MDVQSIFEKYNDVYLDFEDIAEKFSQRPDLHAFILLDRLVPGRGGKRDDMVSAAEHDEIWLDVEPDALARLATEEQIRDLVRCGVRYDEETDSLAMFA